jgi:hypothetical protein
MIIDDIRSRQMKAAVSDGNARLASESTPVPRTDAGEMKFEKITPNFRVRLRLFMLVRNCVNIPLRLQTPPVGGSARLQSHLRPFLMMQAALGR